MDGAQRSVHAALQRVRSARAEEAYGRSNLARLRRDLERCLGALEGVRRASSPYATDPDLVPEDERPPRASPSPRAPVLPPDGE